MSGDAQELGAVFERCQQVRAHDVARDAHDEEFARPLVEHELRRHARIGAAQDLRERILPLHAGGAARREVTLVQRVGRVARVAFHQPLQRVRGRDRVRWRRRTRHRRIGRDGAADAPRCERRERAGLQEMPARHFRFVLRVTTHVTHLDTPLVVRCIRSQTGALPASRRNCHAFHCQCVRVVVVARRGVTCAGASLYRGTGLRRKSRPPGSFGSTGFGTWPVETGSKRLITVGQARVRSQCDRRNLTACFCR